MFYECCDVIAVAGRECPCWQCGETAKAIPMAGLPDFHPTQRVWYLPIQYAGAGYV